jgi:hypothetical protein
LKTLFNLPVPFLPTVNLPLKRDRISAEGDFYGKFTPEYVGPPTPLKGGLFEYLIYYLAKNIKSTVIARSPARRDDEAICPVWPPNPPKGGLI